MDAAECTKLRQRASTLAHRRGRPAERRADARQAAELYSKLWMGFADRIATGDDLCMSRGLLLVKSARARRTLGEYVAAADRLFTLLEREGELDPEQPHAAAALLELARTLEALGMFDTAGGYYLMHAAAVGASGATGHFATVRGLALRLSSGFDEQARQIADQLLESGRASPELEAHVRILLAWNYARRGEWDEVDRYLDDAGMRVVSAAPRLLQAHAHRIRGARLEATDPDRADAEYADAVSLGRETGVREELLGSLALVAYLEPTRARILRAPVDAALRLAQIRSERARTSAAPTLNGSRPTEAHERISQWLQEVSQSATQATDRYRSIVGDLASLASASQRIEAHREMGRLWSDLADTVRATDAPARRSTRQLIDETAERFERHALEAMRSCIEEGESNAIVEDDLLACRRLVHDAGDETTPPMDELRPSAERRQTPLEQSADRPVRSGATATVRHRVRPR